ncbi:hypothetical protein [Lichenibacterium dinghuense]|uniref:hypothetical protein n=1 Tax=Lichenibacterium dinghuense TaxID=2895977 RepID=UPI001F2FDBFF|nr:hypothetical protein [Lichenibacterium sp. 6Y81]
MAKSMARANRSRAMSQMVEDATHWAVATVVTVVTATVVAVVMIVPVATIPVVMVVPVIVPHLLQVRDGHLCNDSSHREGECGRGHKDGCAENHAAQDSEIGFHHLLILQYKMLLLNIKIGMEFPIFIVKSSVFEF